MTFLQLAIAHGVKLCALAALAGIVARGRMGECRGIVAYLLVTLVGNSLTSFWPDRFYTVEFWTMRQWLFDVLKAYIGVEIAYSVFRAFPGTHRTARLAVAGGVVATTIAAGLVPRHAEYEGALEWQPGIVMGTVWLYALTALLVLYYNLPIRPWHRAILMGLTAYNLVFAIAVDALSRGGGFDSAYRWHLGVLESASFLVMMGWWARVAWARDPALGVPPDVLRRIGLEPAR